MSEPTEDFLPLVCPGCKSGEHLHAFGVADGYVSVIQQHREEPLRYLVEVVASNIAAVERVQCDNCGWVGGPAVHSGNPWWELVVDPEKKVRKG